MMTNRQKTGIRISIISLLGLLGLVFPLAGLADNFNFTITNNTPIPIKLGLIDTSQCVNTNTLLVPGQTIPPFGKVAGYVEETCNNKNSRYFYLGLTSPSSGEGLGVIYYNHSYNGDHCAAFYFTFNGLFSNTAYRYQTNSCGTSTSTAATPTISAILPVTIQNYFSSSISVLNDSSISPTPQADYSSYPVGKVINQGSSTNPTSLPFNLQIDQTDISGSFSFANPAKLHGGVDTGHYCAFTYGYQTDGEGNISCVASGSPVGNYPTLKCPTSGVTSYSISNGCSVTLQVQQGVDPPKPPTNFQVTLTNNLYYDTWNLFSYSPQSQFPTPPPSSINPGASPVTVTTTVPTQSQNFSADVEYEIKRTGTNAALDNDIDYLCRLNYGLLSDGMSPMTPTTTCFDNSNSQNPVPVSCSNYKNISCQPTSQPCNGNTCFAGVNIGYTASPVVNVEVDNNADASQGPNGVLNIISSLPNYTNPTYFSTSPTSSIAVGGSNSFVYKVQQQQMATAPQIVYSYAGYPQLTCTVNFDDWGSNQGCQVTATPYNPAATPAVIACSTTPYLDSKSMCSATVTVSLMTGFPDLINFTVHNEFYDTITSDDNQTTVYDGQAPQTFSTPVTIGQLPYDQTVTYRMASSSSGDGQCQIKYGWNQSQGCYATAIALGTPTPSCYAPTPKMNNGVCQIDLYFKMPNTPDDTTPTMRLRVAKPVPPAQVQSGDLSGLEFTPNDANSALIDTASGGVIPSLDVWPSPMPTGVDVTGTFSWNVINANNGSCVGNWDNCVVNDSAANLNNATMPTALSNNNQLVYSTSALSNAYTYQANITLQPNLNNQFYNLQSCQNDPTDNSAQSVGKHLVCSFQLPSNKK